MHFGKNNTRHHKKPKQSPSVCPSVSRGTGLNGSWHLSSFAQGLLRPPEAGSSGELGGDNWAETWKYPRPLPRTAGPTLTRSSPTRTALAPSCHRTVPRGPGVTGFIMHPCWTPSFSRLTPRLPCQCFGTTSQMNYLH